MATKQMTLEVWNACQAYLNRLGQAEYSAGMAKHLQAGRKRANYQHTISAYHRTLVELLGDNDEEGFKALKMTEGDRSALGF